MDTLLISAYEPGGIVRELGEVEDTGLVLGGGEAVLTGAGARQLQVLLAADLKRPFEVQRGGERLSGCRLLGTANVTSPGLPGDNQFGLPFPFRTAEIGR